MVLSKYVVQPPSTDLRRYLDAEFRKIQRSIDSVVQAMLGDIDMADIEAGIWTPNVAGLGGAGVATYTAREGFYYRIGKLVFACYSFTTSAHTGAGQITITNFPFKARTLLASHMTGAVYSSTHAAVAALLGVNSTLMQFYAVSGAAVNIAAAMNFAGSICYVTD